MRYIKWFVQLEATPTDPRLLQNDFIWNAAVDRGVRASARGIAPRNRFVLGKHILRLSLLRDSVGWVIFGQDLVVCCDRRVFLEWEISFKLERIARLIVVIPMIVRWWRDGRQLGVQRAPNGYRRSGWEMEPAFLVVESFVLSGRLGLL